ncbi:MAG: class I SAM-dependent methyltransferase [Desulfatiglans sp.]|nr:class I SAM-dependent methyltransferase [Desulfatiglans sp.]
MMKREEKSKSSLHEDVITHYSSGYEEKRLDINEGKIERERTRELLQRFLPPTPATIIDSGGGTGKHALWLARKGYEVHLVDIVPLHIELAKEESAQQPEYPLSSAEVGDACTLNRNDNSVDAALLFGPLYHLTDKRDRLIALSEAYRVLRKGGVLMAVGISRFASTFDGLRSEYLKDPKFVEIVNGDLKNGLHKNFTDNPFYFMDTFFHHPNELKAELAEVGFSDSRVYGVEGPSWLAPNIDEWWKDEAQRNVLLEIARRLESEPTLLGISSHLMAVGVKG